MLDSWNDGPARSAILEFVESVTTPGSTFVEPVERIATFDNDGTLWCEKPRYVQAEFVLRRRGEEPQTGATTQDTNDEPATGGRRRRVRELLDHVPDLVAGVADVTRGITTEQFETLVREFFDTAIHPALGKRYTQLAYKPMIELIDLLKANDFHVYICTGGGRDFVRVISEEVYGIPRDRVIGSAGTIEFRDGDLYRKKGIELPIDDGPGKPIHIWRRTGRKPLFACGNANGDREMLEIARFPLLIRHDDAEREFAYIEKAEEVLAEATLRGWTTVSMKRDFRVVF